MLEYVAAYTDNESLIFHRGQWQPIDAVNRITEVPITDALRRQERLWYFNCKNIPFSRVSDLSRCLALLYISRRI